MWNRHSAYLPPDIDLRSTVSPEDAGRKARANGETKSPHLRAG